jgi:hypothetical protein
MNREPWRVLRVTPEVRAKFEEHCKLRGVAITDVLEDLIIRELKAPGQEVLQPTG